jgi:hypothetical protein
MEIKLSDLKVGDLVYYIDGFNNINIKKIIKITKTQIQTKHDKYNRMSGKNIGGTTYFFEYIYPVTDEILEKYYIQVTKRKFNLINNVIVGNEKELNNKQAELLQKFVTDWESSL